MVDEIRRIEQGDYNIILNKPCEIDFSVDDELMKVSFVEDTKDDILKYILMKLKSEYKCETEFEALSHWEDYKGVLNGR